MPDDRARARRSSPTGARRSRWRSTRPRPGDTGRDRRQGPRAGPGVRGRPQDPLRRPRGRPRGAARAPMIELAAERDRRRRPGPRSPAPGADAGGPGRPGRRSTPARSAAATSSSASRGARVDGGEFAAGGDRGRRLGGRRRLPSVPPALIASDPRRGPGSSPPPTRWLACRRWRAAWRRALGCPRGRDHRLGRQDLGQGHRPGAAAGSGPRQPREPQHRDRAAADAARGPAGDRGAGAGDGDARIGPDRRALRRSPSPRSP